MKMQNGILATCAVTLILTGCGSSGDAGRDANSGAERVSGWDATNACALLDKAEVGAALGDEVSETNLALVNQASGPNAATSECTYMLASGSRASLMARNSPIADNTDASIKLARNATQETVSAFTDKKVEDIPGIGKAAFFVPGINQLNVFIDDKRFVILTISSAPNESAKATAVDLFAKIRS